MKHAVIRGYYGQHNAGDDAFMIVSAWGARKYCNCGSVYAAANTIPETHGYPIKPLYMAHDFRGSTRLNRIWDHWICRHSANIIFGGGSNFHTSKEMQYCSKLLGLSRHGKHFAIGVSIGPFKDTDAEDACAKLLNQFSFVGVRDRYSYDRARTLVSDERVELTFDIAPLLLTATGMSISDNSISRRGFGVSLCNYERFVGHDKMLESKRLQNVADAIRYCAIKGFLDEIVLIDFNSHPVKGDHSVHQELRTRIEDCVKVRHIPYAGDPVTTMQDIANLQGILAMRLHAAVFAFCVKTPVLMLAYHEKCRGWADMVGMPSWMVKSATQSDFEEIAHGIEQLLCSAPQLPSLTPDDAIDQAFRNWHGIQINN
ncbi:MAG: polysaccharide pyruvyl transferase family protein [Proteobacteria bacterium]|nr:polysaccharide pyruvyl transferase family protein [Pseudomonadota bacterium]